MRLGRGPVDGEERAGYAVARPEGGGVVALISAATDDEALAEVERATRGEAVACEPALAGAAAGRGWTVRELSKAERYERAHAAVALFCQQMFGQVGDPGVVLDFLTAARAFEAGWGKRTLWRADVRITGTLLGEAVDVTFSVLAVAHPDFMIVALPPDQMARVEDGETPIDRLDRLEVVLRDEPAAAIAALGEVYGLEHVPSPGMRFEGRFLRLEDRLLTWMTAIMYAIKNQLLGKQGTRYTPLVGGELLAAVGETAGL